MIKKFTFSLFLLMFCFRILNSQTYIPMPLQNCNWYYSVGSGTSNSSLMQTCLYNDNYKLYPNGDTIISAKRYIKMYSEWLNGSGGAISGPPCSPYSPPSSTLTLVYGLRQDTFARKIYMLTFSSSNPETLMYDFNLVKNDTVKTSLADFGSIPPCGTTRYRIIDSVYYQLYSDGICRKTYKLKPFANCVGMTAVDYYIEGFGTEASLNTKTKYINQNFGGFGMGSMQSVSLSNLVINSNTITATTNTCSPLGIKGSFLSDLKIYPNPFNEKITIQNPSNDKINKVELFTLLGEKQNIDLITETDKILINTANLPNGIYFLQLHSLNSEIHKRIIKVQ